MAHTPSLRCLRLLSWDGLNWGSYHGPHTFSKVSSPVVMGGLNLGSYNGPHTFSKVSSPVVMGRSDPGLIHSPHTFSKVSSSFIGGRILLQLRCFKVAPKKFSTTMCTMGEIIATDYIERETCGILLAILHLDFYVWSFCAFLLDSSTYTNSL